MEEILEIKYYKIKQIQIYTEEMFEIVKIRYSLIYNIIYHQHLLCLK